MSVSATTAAMEELRQANKLSRRKALEADAAALELKRAGLLSDVAVKRREIGGIEGMIAELQTFLNTKNLELEDMLSSYELATREHAEIEARIARATK